MNKKLEKIKNIEDIRNVLGDLVRFAERHYFRYTPHIVFMEIDGHMGGACYLSRGGNETIIIDPYTDNNTQSICLDKRKEADIVIIHKKPVTKNKYESIFYILIHEIGHLLYDRTTQERKNLMGKNYLKIRRTCQKIDFSGKDFELGLANEKKKLRNKEEWARKNSEKALVHICVELWAIKQFKKHRKEIKEITSHWKPNLFNGKNPFGEQMLRGNM